MIRLIARVVILLTTLSSACVFAGIAVVTSPKTTGNSLDVGQVRSLYLGRASTLSDGTPVKVVDQREGSTTRARFISSVLQKEEQQLREYWTRQVFTGTGVPPMAVAGDKEVIDVVLSKPGYIGYIDSSEVSQKVKVLYQTE